jgi:hypothetical protein
LEASAFSAAQSAGDDEWGLREPTGFEAPSFGIIVSSPCDGTDQVGFSGVSVLTNDVAASEPEGLTLTVFSTGPGASLERAASDGDATRLGGTEGLEQSQADVGATEGGDSTLQFQNTATGRASQPEAPQGLEGTGYGIATRSTKSTGDAERQAGEDESGFVPSQLIRITSTLVTPATGGSPMTVWTRVQPTPVSFPPVSAASERASAGHATMELGSATESPAAASALASVVETSEGEEGATGKETGVASGSVTESPAAASALPTPSATSDPGALAKAGWYKSMWWIWLIIVGVVVAAVLFALSIICTRRNSSTSQRAHAEVTQESAFKPELLAAKATGGDAKKVVQSELDCMTQENPMWDQDLSGSGVYFDSAESGPGDVAAGVAGLKPRFPVTAAGAPSDRSEGEAEVWGTVTLTKRLATNQVGGPVMGEGDGDDDELKYEEEGGERDDGGEPEGPDDELDGDLFDDDGQEQDGEYAYDDDQPPGEGDVADFRPWDVGGEFPFDPRVDDRYFQHSSDDEVEPDPPTSDEFEFDDEEPLRL